MTIRKVDVWECVECGKRYDYERSECSCERKLKAGKLVGPFELIKKTYSGWECECLLCGNIKDIHITNLRRQKSCGCVPRHIEIQSINKKSCSYLCRKCNQIRIDQVPIFEWCHYDEE